MSYMLLMIEQPGERLSPPEAERRDRYERMVAFADDLSARGVLRTADALALPDKEGVRDPQAWTEPRRGRRALCRGQGDRRRLLLSRRRDPRRGGRHRQGMPGGGMVHRRGPSCRALLRGHPVAACRRIMLVSRRQETTVPANCHLHVAIVRLCSFNPWVKRRTMP